MKHLTPLETWVYLQAKRNALFVDVRMEIEYLYAGHPPGVVHVPWYEYPQMHVNPPGFAEQVRREAGGDSARPVVLSRCGKRTVEAGHALEAAGFSEVVNVLHGFEGELDEHFQRGRLNGWRHDGLPWEQL
jgi:rhodanese-related sulfurtransferase